MALSRSDQIRNRREREFQKHALAELSKSKKQPWYQTPFGLWVLSATVIAIGGAFFSTQSSCYTTAENLAEAHDKILAELTYREKRVYQAVQETKTLPETTERISQIPASKSEYQARTSISLLARLAYLRSRTDRPLKASLAPYASAILYDHTIYEISQDEVEDARERLSKEVLARRRDAVEHFAFFPSCSYWSSVQTLLGLRPPIATTHPSNSLFEDDTFRSQRTR